MARACSQLGERGHERKKNPDVAQGAGARDEARSWGLNSPGSRSDRRRLGSPKEGLDST